MQSLFQFGPKNQPYADKKECGRGGCHVPVSTIGCVLRGCTKRAADQEGVGPNRDKKDPSYMKEPMYVEEPGWLLFQNADDVNPYLYDFDAFLIIRGKKWDRPSEGLGLQRLIERLQNRDRRNSDYWFQTAITR